MHVYSHMQMYLEFGMFTSLSIHAQILPRVCYFDHALRSLHGRAHHRGKASMVTVTGARRLACRSTAPSLIPSILLPWGVRPIFGQLPVKTYTCMQLRLMLRSAVHSSPRHDFRKMTRPQRVQVARTRDSLVMTPRHLIIMSSLSLCAFWESIMFHYA